MKFGALVIALFGLLACDDDDTNTPADDTTGGSARDFVLRVENVAPWTVMKGSTQATKTTAVDGPAASGEAFQVRFSGGAGQFVSFGAMLSESNDWFFATGPDGIPLFTDGVPTSGDVTKYVQLWDAGTEANQEPFVGDAVGTRQPTRDFGAADPDTSVRVVTESTVLVNGTTFHVPATASMIRVTLTPGADRQFTLRIENVSNPNTMATSFGRRAVHISPLVWTMHTQPAPLFEPGQPAPSNGLEQLAEAGQPDTLGTTLRVSRGFATPLSPGVAVVATRGDILFTPGSADRGIGLEQLAEDGNPATLEAALNASPPDGVISVATFTTPVGAAAEGPAGQGQAFELVVHAAPGDTLSLATMFGMSNDWFFASRPEGIAFFDRDIPRSADVTSEVVLYDLGTEADEELAIGPNTAPQQPAPNTGRADRVTTVREVTVDRYGVPPVQHIRVTLRPQ
jgi:hypothetical protein